MGVPKKGEKPTLRHTDESLMDSRTKELKVDRKEKLSLKKQRITVASSDQVLFEGLLTDLLKNAMKEGKPLNFKQARKALGLETPDECYQHFKSSSSDGTNEKSVTRWIRALINQHRVIAREPSAQAQQQAATG